jgi:hypothetical protein
MQTTTKLPPRSKNSTKIFTAEDYFHRLKDKSERMGTLHQNLQHTREPPDVFRLKRATDVPVYVVKKNRSKIESSPPSQISLPIKKDSRNSAPSTNRMNSNEVAPKKSGFLAGITKLFKKKPLPPASTQKIENENLVVNTSDDQFQFNQPLVTPPPTTKESVKRPISVDMKPQPLLTESTQREESQSQIENSRTEKERVSPQPEMTNSSPSGEAPLWEIFSQGPNSPIFECTNLNSAETLNLPSTPSPRSTRSITAEVVEEASPTPEPKSSKSSTSPSISNPGATEGKMTSEDFDENAMEVWECYQVNEDTDSENNLRERKVTWLFSNGGPSQSSGTTENEEGSEKAHLPRLFGQIVNPTQTSSSKKEYSKYYMKPLEIRSSSALKKGKVSTCKVAKHVSYSSIEIRFYDYTFGQGIPSDGGPSLGLNWEFDPSLTLSSDLEIFEEFRGGIVPDDADDDEEWNDNWRIPRF